MNWEAIGVFAEIVGAATVVITLIYLGRQIRLSREESQVHGTYASFELYANWRAHLINNPDLAELIAKANRGEELTDAENARAGVFIEDLPIATYVSHTTSAKSNPLYRRGADIGYLAAFLKVNPGLVPHWERTRVLLEDMNPEFPSAVDNLLAQPQNKSLL